jgi:hypothetical protein
MKDTLQILRHASIKTTGDVYVQEIQASVRAAINSRTRAIFRQRGKTRSVGTMVHHKRRPNRRKVANTTVPNGSKLSEGIAVSA